MQKHILSTCLAVSIIANASFVSAASSDSSNELSGEESAAVLGGLLLLGGIMTLHQQSVTKAENAATEKATKTLTVKPGHTYLWSSGDNDTSLVIEYIESCTPAKQYQVTSKLINGTAEVDDENVAIKNEECTKKYDSRHKTVKEYAGDPWGLKVRFAKIESRPKKPSKGFFESFRELGEALAAPGAPPLEQVSPAKKACQDKCIATERNTLALCQGMSDESPGLFAGSSPRHECENNAGAASYSCWSSCRNL